MGRSTPIPHVLAWAIDHPWALTPDALRVVATVLARRANGIDVEPRPAALSVSRTEPEPKPAPGSVAILPIHGVITPRGNMLSDISGAASFEAARSELDALVADPAVSTIVLDFDSPGGSVAGASEFAGAVRAARDQKRIIACAYHQCCSAAYWAASGATEIVATPSALVGSLGVYTVHEDLSKALEQEGISLTYVAEGKYKTDGNPAEPLSETALTRLRALVADPYSRMLADVAAGRGTSPEAVRAGYGEGATLTAAEALKAGLIDRVETFEETIARAVTLPPLVAAPSARIPRAAEELAIHREISGLGFF